MLKVQLIVLVLNAVLASPPLARSRQELQRYKKFIETNEIGKTMALILESRMASNPLAKPWENSAKYQGDIVLDSEHADQMIQAYSERKAYIWPYTKWPQNTVVYEFGAGEFERRQQEAILAAISEIEANTCVKFRLRRPGETNFVRLTGRSDGCYAHVGYWSTRGVHTLNLARDAPGRGCMLHTIIIHEWLHIVGFVHMQSTHNRDNYVKVMWENMWPGTEHNFEKYSSQVVSNLGLPYDYASNMHYGPYGFSINGKPTLVPFYDYLNQMGQLDYVTELDWLRVNRHYNCPGAWSDGFRNQSSEAFQEHR